MFDVSHMGQLRLWGAKRLEFLESIVVGDLVSYTTRTKQNKTKQNK